MNPIDAVKICQGMASQGQSQDLGAMAAPFLTKDQFAEHVNASLFPYAHLAGTALDAFHAEHVGEKTSMPAMEF
jgi:hypothetical protein